jgi:hypothetical protein
MNYNLYLGDFVEDPKYELSEDERLLTDSVNKIGSTERYLGTPRGALKFEEVKDDVRIAQQFFIDYGYGPFPKGLKTQFRQHLAYFRANLDAYFELIRNTVFCKDEIYWRSITERGDFATFIKKSREQSLQNMISYAGGVLDEEYTHDTYDGYDSIIHERYLLNWDETEDVYDYHYSLMDSNDCHVDEFRVKLRKLLKTYPFEPDTNYKLPFLDKIAGKKTSLLDKCKTTDLPNVWSPGFEIGEGWCATRRVIPIEAGNIRDTGVPDISSLMKLKYMHHQVYRYLETLPFSGNSHFETLNRRISRLQGGKELYAHIDFKKFGFTFPRPIFNATVEELGIPECRIDDFILETDEGPLRTKRGGILGWFDAVVSIATIAILLDTATENGWRDFDMLQFNDDIEISFDDMSQPEAEIRLYKSCEALEYHDFILSWRKCFVSRMSIFLEQYDSFGDFNEKFSKTQLAVRHFATALVSPFRWETKLRFNLGHFYGYTAALRDEIFSKWPEREDDENSRTVETGGYWSTGFGGLNTALEEASWGDLAYFNGMRRYREPDMAPKWVYVDLSQLVQRRRKLVRETWVSDRPKPGVIKLDDKPEYGHEAKEALDLLAEDCEKPSLPPRLPARKPLESPTTWEIDPG